MQEGVAVEGSRKCMPPDASRHNGRPNCTTHEQSLQRMSARQPRYSGGTGSSANCSSWSVCLALQVSRALKQALRAAPRAAAAAAAAAHENPDPVATAAPCLAVDLAPVRGVVAQRLLADWAGGAHCIGVGLQLLQQETNRTVGRGRPVRHTNDGAGGGTRRWGWPQL